MSDNNKSYRIKANIHEDKVLNVNLNQNFNILEVLSLKIGTESFYKFHTSNYGCVAGRVLANEGFGIPNAKISIFISATTEDLEDNILSYLYPYTATSTKNEDNIRYNLLPDEQLSDCHRNVGTFPSKRMVLDDDNVLEVYDKYYKFTTRTNNAGDYIIFGVPVGNQTIHVDIDLSDIGILSQSPRDMIYKGYNINQFENANMFKKSTDLDNLTQIITQNQNVYVYPFWGEESESDIAISRKDIDIQYEFTPTCVFMGSLITDDKSNGISKRCIPSERMGKMDRLTTGKGTIEMIRKKMDGTVEEFIVQGNELIDGNGVWCYQIPMNLDYVRTDEYGNIVPTDDETKGIPTRTKVRFRISLTEFETEGEYSHLAKVLVPNNPTSKDSYDYVFGTNTSEESFKDLFWNNVYTVKSYIPRLQMLNLDRNKRFSGIKAVNVNNSNNPIPYNNMRVDLTFMFSLQCAVFRVLIWVIGAVNTIASKIAGIEESCGVFKINIGDDFLEGGGRCVYIGDGYCPSMEGWYFAPNCNVEDNEERTSRLLQNTYNAIGQEAIDTESVQYNNNDSSETKCLATSIEYFVQCVELTFAMEYDVIQFDFYNDWINGMIYMPRWFADIRQKRSFLWGLIKVKPKINACMEGTYNGWFERRFTQQCALEYTIDDNKNFTKVITKGGCTEVGLQRCNKRLGRKYKKILINSKPGGGLVHDEQVSSGEYAYYFRPCEWVINGIDRNYETKCNLFATDIVLLGSLDENNRQGIPQTFKKLTSSSYQMPDPLASTNLGVEGYVYGSDSSAGVLCNQSDYKTAKISRLSSNFNSVQTWRSGQQPDTEDTYDETEYAVTEVAGIDWGYSGPNQGKSVRDKLYYPGGHFLGISCLESEVNVKSCINLTRICEMGSIMSQRQTLIKKGDKGYEYSYLVPTGFISGDEINDYGFKNEFATLNYNGLKTKLNKDTNLLEYDFESISPINFNGEFKSFIDKSDDYYNKLEGFDDDELGSANSATAYKRTLEENSNDYYNFRFNLHKDANGEISAATKIRKYLNATQDLYSKVISVSLPMYENSFYFYFGLKQGNTALDNFYRDFFAVCPSLKEYEPTVNVESENTSFCSNDGKIIITTKKIENPYYKIGNSEYVRLTGGSVTLTGLTVGLYEIFVYGENLDSAIEKSVRIERDEPKVYRELSYIKEDYIEQKEEKEISDDNGKIKFTSDIFYDTNVWAIVVYTKDILEVDESGAQGYYANVIRNNNSTIEGDLLHYYVATAYTENTIEDFVVTGWGGNAVYYFDIYYYCNNTNRNVKTIIGPTLNMPTNIDIIFNSNKKTSYKRIVLPMVKYAESIGYDKKLIYENWYDIFLNSGKTAFNSAIYNGAIKGRYEDSVLREMEYNLKCALFYKNSQAQKNNAKGSILFECTTPNPPYTLYMTGGSETWTNDILNINEVAEATNFAGNFISPTNDAPYKKGYYLYDYEKDNDKLPYEANIVDTQDILPEKNCSLALPSIYRPYFFRAFYGSLYSMTTDNFSIAVVNGIYNNEIYINAYATPIGMVAFERIGEDYGEVVSSLDRDFEKNYATGTYKCGCSRITDKKYKIYTFDKTYDASANATKGMISLELQVGFIEDSQGASGSLDTKVRYYYPSSTSEGMASLKYLTAATPYVFTSNGNKVQYNETYWYSQSYWNNYESEILQKGIVWNDAMTSFIRNYYTEMTHYEIDNKDVDKIADDSEVIAIYDSDVLEEYVNIPIVTEIEEGKYKITSNGVTPRHISAISMIRVYSGREFKYIVHGGYY